MLLICLDKHTVVVCDRCKAGCPLSRQPGECAFTAGVRAENVAMALGWFRPLVEVGVGRGLFVDRLLHLCPGCSAAPGTVIDGP